MDGATVDVVVDFPSNGIYTHSIIKKIINLKIT